MTTRIIENSIWDVPDNNWNLKEDYLNENQKKSVVDGKNILAVIEGVFFVPDGVSRNERYYPRTFWESILSDNDVRERLSSKVMFGEIGHNDRPVCESDLTEGKVSHIITNLWIDESTGMGMGQAYVLGTEAGKNLYVYMKAGCKIKTSSRASGDYKQNETHDGLPIVDETNYYLETFDFVINPGFLETNPLIKENVNRIKDDMRSVDMEFGKELLEHVKKEKDTLNETLISLREAKAVTESKNQELSEKVNLLESQVKELSEAKEKFEKFETEAKELSEKVNSISEELKAYKEACDNGSAEELKENLEKSANLLEEYAKNGKPEDISNTIKQLKETNKKYEECGSLEDLEETLPVVEYVLEEISKLGTLDEVKEIFEMANQLTEKIQNEKFEDLVIKVSREYKTPVENVKKLLESVGEKETVNILKAVAESNKKIVRETKIVEEKTPEAKTPAKDRPVVSEIFRTMNNYRK